MSNTDRRQLLRELNELLRIDATTAFEEPPRRVAVPNVDGRMAWVANPAHGEMRARRRRIEEIRRALIARDR